MADLQTLLSYFLQDLYAGTLGVSFKFGAISFSLSGTASGIFSAVADGKFNFTNAAGTTGVGLDVSVNNSSVKFRNVAQNADADVTARSLTTTAGTIDLTMAGRIGTYKNVTTAGWGVPAIQAQARAAAVTNVGTASVATYTVGAADGTFQVSANVLVTTSTTHTFSVDVTYTDESNVARTLVLPVAQLAGTFVTTGLITNVTGVGPYESAAMTIRVKASTTITIRTSSGGTFTAVVYNIDGTIIQIG